MIAYYNEFDPAAAEWLRWLIAHGHIAPGVVDSRSITEVQPDDLIGFTQCHFFAGIGGWSYAARLAGWPDDRPLWTGSCPCQPFSVAGKGGGVDDARHLWPDFFRLIRECRPPVIWGEQVSAAAGKRTRVDEEMLEMWRREDVLGFLQDKGQARQFEWLSCSMQDVLQNPAGGLSDWFEDAAVGIFQEIPDHASRIYSGGRSENASQGGGAGFRSGQLAAGTDGPGGRGQVRIVGDGVSAGWRQDVGQSIAGPDRAETWLHDYERAGGFILAERDDEHLGRGAGVGDSGGDQGAAGDGRSAPAGAVGEKPEGAIVEDWLDGVRFDLDAISYSFGCVDVPACAVDAPHIRSRLWWCAVADAVNEGSLRPRFGAQSQGTFDGVQHGNENDGLDAGRRALADAESIERGAGLCQDRAIENRTFTANGHGVDLGNAIGARLEGQRGDGDDGTGRAQPARSASSPDGRNMADADGLRPQEHGLFSAGISVETDGRNGTFWTDAEWLTCHDGKARRSQRGTSLLVDGLPGRVAAWRGFGNAIVPQVAAEVIAAFMETTP